MKLLRPEHLAANQRARLWYLTATHRSPAARLGSPGAQLVNVIGELMPVHSQPRCRLFFPEVQYVPDAGVIHQEYANALQRGLKLPTTRRYLFFCRRSPGDRANRASFGCSGSARDTPRQTALDL